MIDILDAHDASPEEVEALSNPDKLKALDPAQSDESDVIDFVLSALMEVN